MVQKKAAQPKSEEKTIGKKAEVLDAAADDDLNEREEDEDQNADLEEKEPEPTDQPSDTKKSAAEIKKMFETQLRLDFSKVKAIQRAKDEYKR